jgi:dTDP-4-dehydrorhamnose reductase
VKLHVTGATGYLGSELVRLRPDATTERVEVRDAGAVWELFGRLRPDVVIHTAYRQDEDDVNTTGSENVARAAAAVGARLVHLSTDVVFDGRKGTPYVEEDPLSPLTEYGRAKAEAEVRVALAHPEALLVRTSLMYGGATHARALRRASKHELAARDPGFTFYTNEIRSPVQVTDLAKALLELAELDTAGPLHVAGADNVSRAEFAELITGAPVSSGTAPETRPLDCSLDSSRARALLRTQLRGVREVLG